MLHISIHPGDGVTAIRLKGHLNNRWVAELDKLCLDFRSANPGHTLLLDVEELRLVNAAGRVLLRRLRASGIPLVNATPLFEKLLDQAPGGKDKP